MTLGRSVSLVKLGLFLVAVSVAATGCRDHLYQFRSIANGDAVLMSKAEPGLVAFPSTASSVSIKIPRTAVTPMVRLDGPGRRPPGTLVRGAEGVTERTARC